jgi:hypothetical protein
LTSSYTEGVDLSGFDAPELEPETDGRPPWPTPEPEIYHGLLGEIVQAVAPETEADPIGILSSLMVMLGAWAGDGHRRYQGGHHRAKIYVVLVGETGTGRKGTATDVASDLLEAAGISLSEIRVSGIASGEAVPGIYRRRQDAADEAAEKSGRVVLPDYRMLIDEREFGQLLAKMNRDGSTLSQMVRNAWDGAILSNHKAQEGSDVLRHHIGMIGNTTRGELRRRLATADAANGFGNRILFLAVRRPHVITDPRPPATLVAGRLEELEIVARESQLTVDMVMSADAKAAWRRFYREEAARLRLGLLGAVTGRTEAQVIRLAMLYAITDVSDVIEREHLEAAIAFATYARASARWVFGESTGDPTADEVLGLLRRTPEHRAGWQVVREELGIRRASDMTEAVAILEDGRLVRTVKERRVGGGRPARFLELRKGPE